MSWIFGANFYSAAMQKQFEETGITFSTRQLYQFSFLCTIAWCIFQFALVPLHFVEFFGEQPTIDAAVAYVSSFLILPHPTIPPTANGGARGGTRTRHGGGNPEMPPFFPM
jgi:hypothetical protein